MVKQTLPAPENFYLAVLFIPWHHYTRDYASGPVGRLSKAVLILASVVSVFIEPK
jgi:hypothetical protein